jgi:hypothetical protein
MNAIKLIFVYVHYPVVLSAIMKELNTVEHN